MHWQCSTYSLVIAINPTNKRNFEVFPQIVSIHNQKLFPRITADSTSLIYSDSSLLIYKSHNPSSILVSKKAHNTRPCKVHETNLGRRNACGRCVYRLPVLNSIDLHLQDRYYRLEECFKGQIIKSYPISTSFFCSSMPCYCGILGLIR